MVSALPLEAVNVIYNNIGYIKGFVEEWWRFNEFEVIMVEWMHNDKGKSNDKDKVYVYYKKEDIGKCLNILKEPSNSTQRKQTREENQITSLKSYWLVKEKIIERSNIIKKKKMMEQRAYYYEPIFISFENVRYHYKYQMYFFSLRLGNRKRGDVDSLMKYFERKDLKERSKMPSPVKDKIESKMMSVVRDNAL